MMRQLSLLLTILLCSCTQVTDRGNSKARAATGAGSCIQKDSTNNSTLCLERSEQSEFDSVMCQSAQGTWSVKPCDKSQYERICKQETIETIDDGEPHTVLYTYYFKADSSFFCAGDEVTVGSSPAVPADEPGPQDDLAEPTPSVMNGQALYLEKGCVSCHGALEASTLRGFSAESIIRAYDAAQHSNVKWPSAEEALAIRDALALPREEWIALGQSRYAALCQSCHLPIAQSSILDQTLAGMTRARSLTAHQTVSWPLERDTRAIEAALKEP